MCSISSAVTIAACWDVTPNTAVDMYFISLFLQFLTMALTFIVILLCDFIVLLFLIIFIFTFISHVSHLLSFLLPTCCHSSPLTFPFSSPIDVVQAFCSLLLSFFFYLAYSSVLKLEVKCCPIMLIPVYQTVPITCHVTVIFILTAVRTSNLKCLY